MVWEKVGILWKYPGMFQSDIDFIVNPKVVFYLVQLVKVRDFCATLLCTARPYCAVGLQR